MKRHIELCVDLKDHRTAKDGLHQYRNLCQSVDPGSLEVVITYLMDLSEARATDARNKADRVALAAAAKISDLDQEETPESIMLSSMTEDGAKDRTDREVVVPWLKFLWETYRGILDLLNKNARFEKVYHKTCEKAFKFCLDYDRNFEFHRLCEMLRNHLSILQKIAGVPGKQNRIIFEWTPESVELHLQTRFSQLEVATSLELWNEGFRTVEDIFQIMQLGKKNPKPRLMAIYYEKLTRIFWVSGNYLFHAYAWYKFYTLTCECRKDLKGEEKNMLASCVLLAALIIPSSSDSNSIEDSTDDIATEKNKQLATLLDFQASPTRKALLSDIVDKGILNDIHPCLLGLYDHIETKFQPLKLVSNIASSIESIKSIPQLAVYAIPLQKVIIVRVVQQLSKVYSVVKMDFIGKLLSALTDISYNNVEKIMIDSVSKKQLQLRIDHTNGCVRFGTLISHVSLIDNQISSLGNSLNKVSIAINKSAETSASKDEAANKRRAFLRNIAASAEADHNSIIKRQKLIQSRKEEIEADHDAIAAAAAASATAAAIEQAKAERDRLDREEEERDKERKRKILEAADIAKLVANLKEYNIIKTEAELALLTVVARNALLSDSKDDHLKQKQDEIRKATEQAKRLDYITRALRIESADVISKKYSSIRDQDLIIYHQRNAEFQVIEEQQHTQRLVEKARFGKFQQLKLKFETTLLEKQRSQYEEHLISLKSKSIQQWRLSRVERARMLYQEDLEREREKELIEEARILKEERDQHEREQHEILRKKREEDEFNEKKREEEEELLRKERETKREADRVLTAELQAKETAEKDQWSRVRQDQPVTQVTEVSNVPWKSKSSTQQSYSSSSSRGYDKGRGFDRGPDKGFDRGPDRGFDRGTDGDKWDKRPHGSSNSGGGGSDWKKKSFSESESPSKGPAPDNWRSKPMDNRRRDGMNDSFGGSRSGGRPDAQKSRDFGAKSTSSDEAWKRSSNK
jgi:translation initiation factor 3 subunit A